MYSAGVIIFCVLYFVQLSSVGVADKDVTWLRVSMTSDSHICVRERICNKDNEGQVVCCQLVICNNFLNTICIRRLLLCCQLFCLNIHSLLFCYIECEFILQLKILSLTGSRYHVQTYPFQPDAAMVAPSDPTNRTTPMLALKG